MRPPPMPFLWASACHLCGRWPAKTPICSDCEAVFSPALDRCPTCALTLVSCTGHCKDSNENADALNQCAAAVDYAGPWPDIVRRFKFEEEVGWAGHLADVMWRVPQIRTLLCETPVWLPIPLSPTKLAARGYNQSWELTKSLHRLLVREASQKERGPVRLCVDRLQRRESLRDQHHLDRQERLRNVDDVFWVGGHTLDHKLDQPVLLVDDVMTTGATLQAAARALKAVGVPAVRAVVFARTPLPSHA